MQTLFTPWRLRYVTAGDSMADECFLCAAGRLPDDPSRLVVWTTPHHVVLLNKHPYTNGHLMVAPRAHVASPLTADSGANGEFWNTVLTAQRVLEQVYHPHGMNLGMNLGTPAGAGVPDHYHLHLVPRWQGDTNFMTVLGEVRLVPEDLGTTQQRLREAFASLTVSGEQLDGRHDA